MEQANSITDYLKILKRYEAYPKQYYRGQLEKYTTISPSIARDPGYSSNESAIYHESIKMKKEEFNGLLMPLEKLAKLQHYGIPTRLVDVTINPLIALYFAVENVDDLSPGNVYLYLVEGYLFDSKEAKLLSILPTIPSHEVNSVIAAYENIFGDSLSQEEVLEIVSTPIIIQYSDTLQNLNPRLLSQQGTFLICGNEVVNGIITNSLKSLDTIAPSVIIRIPYEYKKKVKNELDLKYSINQTRIYPELPSVASYIKEKYKEENLSLDGKYSIVKKEDVSHALAKRVSITIVLTEPMHINQIKSLVISIIDQYKKSENVVWIYVARNGDDYILSNWILRGQWIDPALNEKYRPLTFKNFEKGYYWDYDKSYSTMSDYYNQHIFNDDKTLFVNYHQIWEEFCTIYQTIQYFYQENRWDDLISEILKQKSEITRLYIQLQNFGHSHNKEFGDFLYMFIDCISSIDNLHFWIENETLSAQAKQYQIKKALYKAEDKVEQISQEISDWRDKLHITN
ncbi:FRG domain-containing protein [Enterocloster lavalensis]|uniref:FRG domain-containing protein n=1 Tax=Enterocloster lavalensis TaxID=460384 RepID=UPI0023EFED57|nr:FRG domain-containing protein [Enterocloster lavalensis]